MDDMVKTLTIRNEVYLRLLKAKKENESFSKLFERLLDSANPIDIMSRMRGSVVWKNKRKMLEEIYSKRAERRY